MASWQVVEKSATSSFAQLGERFNLLLLEDGEYYFRDHACYHWKDSKRVFGHLKVCSLSFYFVPRDIQEPIFRVPYKSTTAIEELEDETLSSGEGMFLVSASERIDMKAGDVHRPYQRQQGQFQFHFSLVYTSLEDVLPAIDELCILAQQDGTKEERAIAKERLAEIVQEHEANEHFNPGWLEDDDERVILEEIGNCITALCMQPGRVVLTQYRIYFQPFNVVSNAPIQTYQLDKVLFVMRRVYQLEDLGVEVFFPGKASLYLTFKAPSDRESFIKVLMQQPNLQLEHMRSRDKWTRDWVNGRISNFDYLMYLNREAGRSFKDLTQYPVFPWVIADYSSSTLDLSDPATFRDLSRPIGALNAHRLKDFRERYSELKKLSFAIPGRPGKNLSLDFPPPFLYGCHYSSPGYVVFYLMRSDPQLMLRLQNGRFDAPDRLFWSIQDTWKSVLTLPTDVKELIPEFYSNDASFLVNNDDIDFGMRSNGQRVGDVVLPLWASDAQDFVYKLAEALECPFVSSKLHKWINLVFGYKSRGPAAEAADNVFHYLTYDEIAAKYLEQENDPVMREALRLQMMEFGRTPRQLFTKRHPKRKAGVSPLLACLACAPTQIRGPARPVNTLLGKGWAGRNITPVSRAVFKLTSKKPSRRADTLAWLEQAAANHEPSMLALKQGKGAELVLLVKFVRDAREGRNPYAAGEEMTNILIRACKALSVAPQNRRYILDAGALDLLIDALCSGQQVLSLQALQALAAVSKEDDPRLSSVDRKGLAKVMVYLQQPPTSDAVLAALTITSHLARSTPNRTYFTEHRLLLTLLPILESLSQPSPCSSPEPQASTVSNACSPTAPQSLSALDFSVSPTPPPMPGRMAGSNAVAPLVLPSSPSHAASTMGFPGSPVRRMTTFRPHTPRGALDAQRVANLRQCTLAVAALLQDDAQKDLLLDCTGNGEAASSLQCNGRTSSSDAEGSWGSSGLDLILSLTRASQQAVVQGAAFECLAALTTYDPMRQQIKERDLLPMLLQAATSGPAPVQRPAAEAVANVCADPQLVMASLPNEGGLAAMVAMALSPDQDVQKHAARALWHLVAQPDTRSKVVRAGALNALLVLARSTKRGVQARNLAHKALRVCHDDPASRPQLEAVAAAAGVDIEELVASFTSGGGGTAGPRLSSHPSYGSIHPSGGGAASPQTGSGGSKHWRAPSDMRSAGDTDETPSPNGSRWPSFTGALGGFSSMGMQGSSLRVGLSQDEDGASTPRLTGAQSPHPASPRGGEECASAAKPGNELERIAAEAQRESDGCCEPSSTLPEGSSGDHGDTPLSCAAATSSLTALAVTPNLSTTPPEPDGMLSADNGYDARRRSRASTSMQNGPTSVQQVDGLEAMVEESQDALMPLPIISPVVDAASIVGSSPKHRWQQTQGVPHSPERRHSPSGKVAEAIKKLERLASHQSLEEQLHDV